MTTYVAYDAGLPCKNTSCKSHGKPHPNCRCYGDLAEGGEAFFCSKDRAHEKGCEYYAEGGDTLPDVISDEDFVPDPEITPKAEDNPRDHIGLFGGPVEDPYNKAPDVLPDTAIQEEHAPDVIADEDFIPDSEKYNTVRQQIANVAEGALEGLAGPLATGAELTLSELGVPGMTAEDIRGRKEAGPIKREVAKWGSLAASMAAGVGEAAVLANMVKGSAALKAAITAGLIQAGDQTSKAMLGETDPHDVVGPFLASGVAALFGGLGGWIGGKSSSALKKFADAKYDQEAAEFLAGYGHAAEGGELAKEAEEAFSAGHKAYHTHIDKLGSRTAAGLGYWKGGPMGAIAAEKFLGPKLSAAAKKAGSYAAPAVIRWLSEGANGSLSTMLKYAGDVGEGSSLVSRGIESLFNAAAQPIAATTDKDESLDKLRAYIDDGGMTQNILQQVYDDKEEPQGYAAGGEVQKKTGPVKPVLHDETLATNYPAQNMMLQMARGRVSTYLSSLKPMKHAPKLAFDDAPDDREQKKIYEKALKVAVNPMSVLGEIQKGTVEPEHIRHLNALYPELTQHLQKKITEEIVKSQLDGKKPPYKVRQGLSLMLGAPLSGELTPLAIQSSQAVFQKQRLAQSSASPTQAPASAQAQKSPRKTSSLTKADEAFLTGSQALQRRGQRTA